MMIYLYSIAVFALAYSIKGGWHDKFKYGKYLDNRITPIVIMGLAALPFAPAWQALLFALAFAYCYSSMGEEAGAVGDYKGPHRSDYITAKNPDGSIPFGRSYGIKKALQYGLAWGGLLALVTGCVWFVPAGATFPVCYFLGSSIAAFRGQQGWAYAEPIYGAVMGIAMGVWLDGY